MDGFSSFINPFFVVLVKHSAVALVVPRFATLPISLVGLTRPAIAANVPGAMCGEYEAYHLVPG